MVRSIDPLVPLGTVHLIEFPRTVPGTLIFPKLQLKLFPPLGIELTNTSTTVPPDTNPREGVTLITPISSKFF